MTRQTSPTYRSTANFQRITHVGCCIKRKPRENIKVCVNVSRTSYRQATDRLPTHYQQSAYISGKTCRPTDCRPTVDRLSADRRPTVGRLSADSRPTGFLGSPSSQLPTNRAHGQYWKILVQSCSSLD